MRAMATVAPLSRHVPHTVSGIVCKISVSEKKNG